MTFTVSKKALQWHADHTCERGNEAECHRLLHKTQRLYQYNPEPCTPCMARARLANTSWHICKCGHHVEQADENTICAKCRRIGCFNPEEEIAQ